jgi:5'-3' exonuclease
MTIKGLWDYLQSKKAIECMKLVPRESFGGHRIAIDAGSFAFSLMMSARSKVVRTWTPISGRLNQDAITVIFYRLFFDEVLNLLGKGITPLFVFEHGKHPLKVNETNKREAERVSNLEEIEELYEKIRNDPFSRDQDRNIERLKSLEKNLKSFPSGIKDSLIELLIGVGIPCINCIGEVEAERVASILCICDVAMATFSRDGDCLAHGAPIQIKEMGFPIYTEDEAHETFIVVDRESMLDILDITSEQCTELCVCAGCDYNTNIPKIGFARSLDLIKKYGSIANFPESINRECLNYEECIGEFGMGNVEELVSEECLSFYNLTDWDSFSSLQVKVPENISQTLANLDLQHYEKTYRQKASLLPMAENYIHKTISSFEVDGDSYTTVEVNFPDNGEQYVKYTKSRR